MRLDQTRPPWPLVSANRGDSSTSKGEALFDWMIRSAIPEKTKDFSPHEKKSRALFAQLRAGQILPAFIFLSRESHIRPLVVR
jgi:hypothetical protein